MTIWEEIKSSFHFEQPLKKRSPIEEAEMQPTSSYHTNRVLQSLATRSLSEEIPAFTTEPYCSVTARRILGDGFISPEQITKILGKAHEYEEEVLARLWRTFPSRGVLSRLHSGGAVLVAGPAYEIPLIEIPLHFSTYFRMMDHGYEELHERATKTFALNDTVEPSWIILRKEPANGLLYHHEPSPSKQRLNVAQVSWVLSLNKIIHGTSLIPDFFQRALCF